ncbi:hypothetical protein EIP75_21450 [Aquabacterium soli]|uniref:Peptidase M48 domain-containing protein n=1 Tax=Aquabacterium soli TaxID=2493092 RepID=A0A426V2R0_9BURK|nr:hypothetical protein [Aquabacterium soli]RRS01147.1 hypothetical protein EIP75_21450 [Aquabacterium soli]
MPSHPSPFSPDVERQLLDRLLTVKSWISEFAKVMGKRNPPELKTWISGHMYYAPIRNVIKIPSTHLLTLPDNQLRVAVAHEMGHFSRRWPSFFSWTLVRRLNEEKIADRCSIMLTGATIEDWASSLIAVALIEDPGYLFEQDLVFQARKYVLQRWVNLKKAG